MNIEEYKKLTLPKKRGKYRNDPTNFDGFRFDSKREGFRWLQLRQMEREGKITNLNRQVAFPLVVNGILVAKYRADYVYEQRGKRIVEDSKGGVKTDVYRIKQNLMLACHGIEILET